MISARRETDLPFAGFLTVILPFFTAVVLHVLPWSYETRTVGDLRFLPLAEPSTVTG